MSARWKASETRAGRYEVRWDVGDDGPLLVMAHEDVPWGSDEVCTVPSCRWRGFDHVGLCKFISGETRFGRARVLSEGVERAPEAGEGA